MSHGRSEPAGLHGLRKQVTEVKEKHLECKRKKSKGNMPRGRRGGRGTGRLRERENACWVLCLEGFIPSLKVREGIKALS